MYKELELSDDQLENISGGCAGTTLGLGGLHLGFGFYGGPVVVSQPVTAVQLVPVQTAAVVQPVGVTGVQATTCGVQTLTAGC